MGQATIRTFGSVLLSADLAPSQVAQVKQLLAEVHTTVAPEVIIDLGYHGRGCSRWRVPKLPPGRGDADSLNPSPRNPWSAHAPVHLLGL